MWLTDGQTDGQTDGGHTIIRPKFYFGRIKSNCRLVMRPCLLIAWCKRQSKSLHTKTHLGNSYQVFSLQEDWPGLALKSGGRHGYLTVIVSTTCFKYFIQLMLVCTLFDYSWLTPLCNKCNFTKKNVNVT